MAKSSNNVRSNGAPNSQRGTEVEESFSVPGTIFAGLAKFDAKTGKLDTKLTLAEFQTQLLAWNESQGKLRPVIVEVISSMGGKGSAQIIVPFVCAKLGLDATKGNLDNVRDVLNQMIDSGELVKPMTEEGKAQRGPAAGIQLPNYADNAAG